ncbi:MAG: hypothetical protein H7249_06285 [Chitinophagaceae bacterium]|nr:hypothetical protein [Oligoflexus sp.]
MIRLTLVLLVSSFFGGCMTEADKALWLEAKNTLGPKHEAIAEKEKDNTPAVAPDASRAPIKTSKNTGDKAKDDAAAGIPKEVVPASKSN